MTCVGKICTRVMYRLVNIDAPITYVLTGPTGKKITDKLTENNGNYKDWTKKWNDSFFLWLGLGTWGIIPHIPGFGRSPFRNKETGCDEGCECDWGPTVERLKEYAYSTTFKIGPGWEVKLIGKFTMMVISQSGVCTLKGGTEFALGPDETEALFAASLEPPGDFVPPADLA